MYEKAKGPAELEGLVQTTRIVNRGLNGALDILGATIEFLTFPEPDAIYCMMMGTLPRGVSVPLHSHPDVESFLMLSGAVQVLCHKGERFEWLTVKLGE